MATNPYGSYGRTRPSSPSYGYEGTPSRTQAPAGANRQPLPPQAPERQPSDVQYDLLLQAIRQQPGPQINDDLYRQQMQMIAQQQQMQLAAIAAQQQAMQAAMGQSMAGQAQLNNLIDPRQGTQAHLDSMRLLNQRPDSTFTFLYGY